MAEGIAEASQKGKVAKKLGYREELRLLESIVRSPVAAGGSQSGNTP